MKTFKHIRHTKSCSKEILLEKLKNIRHIALDMDGTIYNGSHLFPFTIPFLETMKKLGIGFSFLTNNPTKSIDDYLAHLAKIGINSTPGEMFTSAQATIEYLKEKHPKFKRLFLLGTDSMIGEFEKAGFASAADDADDIPDAVVVGFDTSLNYPRLCRSAWWASKGVPYIATNPDRVCPNNMRTILVDCGSICTCIERATGRKPDVVIGKPDPRMLGGILSRHRLKPSEVMMVGDRLYTDVQMAANAGALGVLVLSGESTLDDVEKSELKPDIVAQDLSELQKMMAEAKKSAEKSSCT